MGEDLLETAPLPDCVVQDAANGFEAQLADQIGPEHRAVLIGHTANEATGTHWFTVSRTVAERGVPPQDGRPDTRLNGPEVRLSVTAKLPPERVIEAAEQVGSVAFWFMQLSERAEG